MNLYLNLGLLEYLFNPIYYGWGIFLAERLNIYVVVFFAFLILLLFIFLLRHSKKKKKVFLIILFIIIYFFMIIVPFQRGKEIIELKIFGFKLMKSIVKYKDLYGNIPQTLRELYPQFLDDKDLKKINQNVFYWYYSKDYYNEKNSGYKNIIPMINDDYSIHIVIDFLQPYYLRTNRENTDIIITDD